MADIATALSNLARAINYSSTYRESEQLEPFVITPAVTQSSVTKNVSLKGFKVTYISFLVRSMGTAAYVAIGTPGGQEQRLTAVGDTIEIEAPKMAFIESAKIMCIADVADAVVEVGGVLIPSGVLTSEPIR